MCLAEALLRIPDGETADRLIADKIPSGAWDEHLGDSESLLVNASTWGLMLTGRVVALDRNEVGEARSWYGGWPPNSASRWRARRSSRPCASSATSSSWAVTSRPRWRARPARRNATIAIPSTCSGEAALTRADAERYREKYSAAIAAVGRAVEPRESITARHSISIKLSALHPRYEFAQTQRVMRELYPVIEQLVREARDAGIGVTLDAEEADRLELSLLLVDKLLASDVTRGYAGFGLAVQAYQKRAHGPRIEWLLGAAQGHRPAHHAAAGEGRVLGQRDQARAGARPRGLSGVHAQAQYRCVLPGLRATARERRRAHLSTVRHAQCAHHRARGRSLRRRCQPLRVPAPAWHGRGAVRQRGARSLGQVPPAACTRPWVRTRTCCPTWCAACSRTAPTPRSSIASWMAACRPKRSWPIPLPKSTRWNAWRIRAFLCPRTCSRPSARNSAGFNFADGQAVDALLRDCERASQQPWSAAPLVVGSDARRRARAPVCNPANTGGADRRRNQCRCGHGRRRHRRGAARAGATGTHAGGEHRAAILERAAQLFEEHTAALIGTLRARGRQDAARRHRRSARGRGLPALLRGARAPRFFARSRRCRAPPASATCCACAARVCSPASARGIFRWLSTPARWQPRSRPATPWSPSPPSRRR